MLQWEIGIHYLALFIETYHELNIHFVINVQGWMQKKIYVIINLERSSDL